MIELDIPNDNDNQTIHDITSVTWSFKDDLILATIVPSDYAINTGWLAFIDPYDLTIENMTQLFDCFLPDMITTTNDGNTILIACEGEADNNTIKYPQYNPPGSVVLIDIDTYKQINIGFTDFDHDGIKSKLLPNETYLPYLYENFSINAEPEYITCQYDDKYCFVTLQENNVIAILDMITKEFIGISSLGVIDFSINGLDASDMDNGVNITNYPRLYGLRMPDAIDYFTSNNGKHYIFTANEGDSKEFDESRISDMILDKNVFVGVDVDELKLNKNLGRLKVINQLGSEKQDGIYQELYAFSSRDFTIFEVKHADDEQEGGISSISLVYSSKAEFEEITGVLLGKNGFNGDVYVPSFDSRSDDKGPEPESIVTGKCSNGRAYVFIGLERVGGVKLLLFVLSKLLLNEDED